MTKRSGTGSVPLQSRRVQAVALMGLAVAVLALVTGLGIALAPRAVAADFSQKNLPPVFSHPFGTDWMGRDMLARTLAGLSMSIRIGLLTATASAVIAFVLGAVAALSPRLDGAVLWLIDLVMGIPHILLLILISFACGRGFWGVVAGVSLSHWPSLARLMRGEMLQLRQSGYVRMAQKLGTGRLRTVTLHMLPHLAPQFGVGLLLLFPHAILHEAAITFLGFGLPPEQPAIGVILSESMQYLAMGRWWLALFPGALLVLVVLLFDLAGSCLRRLADPGSAHE